MFWKWMFFEALPPNITSNMTSESKGISIWPAQYHLSIFIDIRCQISTSLLFQECRGFKMPKILFYALFPKFFLAVAEKNEMTQCECWELEKASYWTCVHNTHPSSAVGTAVLQAKQKKTAKQFSAAINPFAEYLNIHRFPMCKLDVAFKGLWFVISDLWHYLFMILTAVIFVHETSYFCVTRAPLLYFIRS